MRTTIRIAVLAAGALGAYSIVQSRRREREMLDRAGSTTNASDVDTTEIAPDGDAEQALDAAVEQTFPASDPISIDSAYNKRA